MARNYGWIRDAHDPRDLLYKPILEQPEAAKLPKVFSLRSEMPSIYDQLQLGSCTANEYTAIHQYHQVLQGEPSVNGSRLQVYYDERASEGSLATEDTGAQVRTGFKVGASIGVAPESVWPYSDANPGPFQQKPAQGVYDIAKKREATQYQKINPAGTDKPMRTAIYNRRPIGFGFPVPQNFEDPTWDPSTTPLYLPSVNVRWIGGHAVVVIGWDFSLTRFTVPVFEIRNSWGPDWGDQGHFFMDYRWFDPYRNLASDLWVVVQVM